MSEQENPQKKSKISMLKNKLKMEGGIPIHKPNLGIKNVVPNFLTTKKNKMKSFQHISLQKPKASKQRKKSDTDQYKFDYETSDSEHSTKKIKVGEQDIEEPQEGIYKEEFIKEPIKIEEEITEKEEDIKVEEEQEENKENIGVSDKNEIKKEKELDEEKSESNVDTDTTEQEVKILESEDIKIEMENENKKKIEEDIKVDEQEEIVQSEETQSDIHDINIEITKKEDEMIKEDIPLVKENKKNFEDERKVKMEHTSLVWGTLSNLYGFGSSMMSGIWNYMKRILF